MGLLMRRCRNCEKRRKKLATKMRAIKTKLSKAKKGKSNAQ